MTTKNGNDEELVAGPTIEPAPEREKVPTTFAGFLAMAASDCVGPATDSCTRADACPERRELDSVLAGDLGVVSLLLDPDESFWRLHGDHDHFVVAVSHCPWCGRVLG